MGSHGRCVANKAEFSVDRVSVMAGGFRGLPLLHQTLRAFEFHPAALFILSIANTRAVREALTRVTIVASANSQPPSGS